MTAARGTGLTKSEGNSAGRWGATDAQRRSWLRIGAALVGAAMLPARATGAAASVAGPAVLRLPDEGPCPALDGATAWLNTAPTSTAALRGKVALIDIWTYTCINWMRTAPYVRAWSRKYQADGLVVIGVHSPEFTFEKDLDNVRENAKALQVDHAVAVDSDHAIWRAFDNQYWPAVYLVDARGRVRFHHFGEGRYDETERAIQQLLAEAGVTGVDRTLAEVDARGAEVPADWANLKSPENYLGYGRTENLAVEGRISRDREQTYAAPGRLPLNGWALSGAWSVEKDRSIVRRPGAGVAYRFHARDVNLVMGPIVRGSAARFRVLLDGRSPEDAHGSDVDAAGVGIATGERLYQLIRQPRGVTDRTVEIRFLDPGAAIYAFTFG